MLSDKPRKRGTKRTKGSVQFVSAKEFERLTGERGSVYFGTAPAKQSKNQEVFLCPHCLELLDQRPGVLRCDSCDKTWGG
jgi:hypothetical protein